MSEKITPGESNEYVRRGGDTCPRCMRNGVIGSFIDVHEQRSRMGDSGRPSLAAVSGEEVRARASCLECGFSFVEVYEMNLMRIEDQKATENLRMDQHDYKIRVWDLTNLLIRAVDDGDHDLTELIPEIVDKRLTPDLVHGALRWSIHTDAVTQHREIGALAAEVGEDVDALVKEIARYAVYADVRAAFENGHEWNVRVEA